MSDSDQLPDIRLLSNLADEDGAALTFDRVLWHIAEAQESIDIHMFVWRNDDIGNAIGHAILAAAERGVMVNIKKDTDAFMYERLEMNRKSFFNVPVPATKRLMYKLSGLTFPDTYVEDSYDDTTGQQVMAHPNVNIEWVDHTHTKYYIFDNECMLTGSINIEDRHRKYRDYMVEITGAHLIQRFEQRNASQVEYDPKRSLDFVANKIANGQRRFEIKPTMIDLISAAQESIYIEMAYIGDRDISQAIVAASKRGVHITTLFSKEANIGNDINYRSLHRIYQACDIDIFLTDKMIHSKLMLFDDKKVILGSANTSVFSMQKAVELDLVVQDHPKFLAAVRETRDQRIKESTRVDSADQINGYNRIVAALQQLHQMLH